MRPIIKAIISPDIDDFSTYDPTEPDNFGFLLQMLIGIDGEKGMESFQLVVCTPKWLSETKKENSVVWGEHHLIVFNYDFDSIKQALTVRLRHCAGENWSEIAQKISRFDRWEFEDYNPIERKIIMRPIANLTRINPVPA